MGLTTKIILNGQPHEAKPIEVQEASRPWTDFLLEDGTRLRVHVVIDAVHRLTGEHDARGNPIYYVSARTVSSTFSPEELRKVEGGDDAATRGA